MEVDGIERVPGIHGGEPIITGTRTPVRTVAALYYITYPNNRGRVAAALPHLSPEQLDAALRYYAENTAEIDDLIARQEVAFQELALSR
jgi:uncharacterized protein (DUF433 family)